MGDWDRHWQIRPGEVDYRIGSRADGSGHGEMQRRVPGLGRGDDGQRAERGQVDLGQRLRTRAGNDEGLDRGESEAGRSSRQEWRGRRHLLLRETVETILLSFLGQDGAEEWDQRAFVSRIGGENGLGFG